MAQTLVGRRRQSIFVLVTIGVNQEGYREILGVVEGSREDAESWRNFFRYLKQRGLEHVRLIVSGKTLGVLEASGPSNVRKKLDATQKSDGSQLSTA